MPNIRVTCPACKTELEIDSEFAGKEVECGSCLEVFVANPPGSGGKKSGSGSSAGTSGTGSSRGRKRDDDDEDEDRPKRKPKRRRRDDEDDYDDDEDYYSPPARRGGGGTGLAVTALILGIISLPACCCPLIGFMTSIGAITTGSIGMKNPEGRGLALAGMILGIVGLVLAGINAVAGVAMNVNNGRFR